MSISISEAIGTREIIMQIDNVADMSAETLIQAGVKRIFGVVGGSLNGLTEGGARRSIGFTFAMRRWPLSPRQARRRSPANSRFAPVHAGQVICTLSTACSMHTVAVPPSL